MRGFSLSVYKNYLERPAGNAIIMTQIPPVGQVSSAEPESLWEKALQALDDEEKLDIDFEQADKLSILEDILKAVDEKKCACLKGRWRYKKGNKEIIIRDQLEKVVEWVKKFKEVGDTVVQYDPAHAALPWAGIRFFLQITLSDIQIFGAMVEGMELVSNLITRYTILEKLYLHTTVGIYSLARYRLVNAILVLYTAVLKYLSRARRYYDRNTHKRVLLSAVQTSESSVDVYIRNILDKQADVDAYLRLMDAEFNKSLRDRTHDILSQTQNFQEKVHDVRSGVQVIQRGVQGVRLLLDSSATDNRYLNENVQRLKTILSQLEEPIIRSTTQVSDLHDFLEQNERKELIRWISTIPYREHHKATGKDFMPESGQWLLRNPKFIEWRKSSTKSMLWLHGIPGSGKSKLVYCVIECLNEHNSSNAASAPMAYFYCARNASEPERANPDDIMRSILKQLSCTNLKQPIREPVAGKYKRRKEEADNDGCEPSKFTLQECVDIILALLETNPATIIIDALDECDPARRHELLLALDRIRGESASLVKVFISSRDDQDIVCRLNSLPDIFIHASDNREDIENFILLQVNQCINDKTLLCGNVSDGLRSRIISTLIEGAHGMFRWVSLQIQNICDSRRMKHEKDVDAELGRLPETLWESYDMIYQQIVNSAPTSRQVSENAMKWLLCAQRPLKASEFIAALSIDSEGNYMSLDVSQVLHMCCNMVVLDEKLEVFRFAHLSVHEYLESRDEYTVIETNIFVAERCLDSYIQEPSPEPSGQRNLELNQYAITYWPVHCQNVWTRQLRERLMKKVRQFLFKDCAVAPSFIRWTLAAEQLVGSLAWDNHVRIYLIEFLSSTPTPLFLACQLGWPWLICDIAYIFENFDWDQRNSIENTGIYLASINGHDEVVKLLIESGADIESKDKDYGQTPLSWAAECGHEAVVKLLTEKGADIETTDRNYNQTPLMLAVGKGRTEVVKLLLQSGSDLECSNIWGRTPLSWAAAQGREEMVELLIKNGAHLESRNYLERTPLSEAASHGHEIVVMRLIKGGACPENSDEAGRTPLLLAVKRRHMTVVKLLIQKGADLESRDKHGQTPLLRAILLKSKAMIKLLIEMGANLESEDGKGRTVLSLAARKGNTLAMEVLIEKGANLESKDKDHGQTPLLWAAEYGHKSAVRLLIKNGADLESKSIDGMTALGRAKACKKRAMVRYLIKKGAKYSKMSKNIKNHWRCEQLPAIWRLSNTRPYGQRYPSKI